MKQLRVCSLLKFWIETKVEDFVLPSQSPRNLSPSSPLLPAASSLFDGYSFFIQCNVSLNCVPVISSVHETVAKGLRGAIETSIASLEKKDIIGERERFLQVNPTELKVNHFDK
jgi:hypothetical protein